MYDPHAQSDSLLVQARPKISVNSENSENSDWDEVLRLIVNPKVNPSIVILISTIKQAAAADQLGVVLALRERLVNHPDNDEFVKISSNHEASGLKFISKKYNSTPGLKELCENRQQFINSEKNRISTAIQHFQESAEQIEKYNSDTKPVIEKLINELRPQLFEYLTDLYLSLDEEESISTSFYYKEFQKMIQQGKSVLEKDLSVGDELLNLLYDLLNVFIWVRDFGSTNNFFQPIQSKFVEPVVALESVFEPA